MSNVYMSIIYYWKGVGMEIDGIILSEHSLLLRTFCVFFYEFTKLLHSCRFFWDFHWLRNVKIGLFYFFPPLESHNLSKTYLNTGNLT